MVFLNTTDSDTAYQYFKKVVDVHAIKYIAGALSFKSMGTGQFWEALITFLYVDILDTTGTLYSMARFTGFTDENGDFEGQYFARRLLWVRCFDVNLTLCWVHAESDRLFRRGTTGAASANPTSSGSS
ncbi:Adenine/guanine permease AZG1 [Camellia lanceoleosa]|uniref:Adenine/guanine permease AZG1 n=1 Tax=Camellia lanceoleosa TaxID=1840588 RepID=A0ACC0FN33_9ERIC|nr:Adenine/guanine permease AZG1 [Camellia lanceoleosa]